MLALCFLTTLGYFGNAVNSWFGDIDRSRYKGLDATAFLEKENKQDAEAIAWMKENLTGRPVVLECWGASYTFYERISAMTGFPTVLGWQTHEWLWRSDGTAGFPRIVDERRNDVLTIYFSKEEEAVRQLIEKYNIEYIYVGSSERKCLNDDTISRIYNSASSSNDFSEEINEELLRGLGEVVFESEEDGLGRTSYLVKIAR